MELASLYILITMKMKLIDLNENPKWFGII